MVGARGGLFVFILYILFGVYFLNLSLEFFEVPSSITQFESWINFIGGILIILGGIFYLKSLIRKSSRRGLKKRSLDYLPFH